MREDRTRDRVNQSHLVEGRFEPVQPRLATRDVKQGLNTFVAFVSLVPVKTWRRSSLPSMTWAQPR